MANCVVCEDPIVKECVNIPEDAKEKYNLHRVCTWCSLDVMQGRIEVPEES